jgi:hypothetical protein
MVEQHEIIRKKRKACHEAPEGCVYSESASAMLAMQNERIGKLSRQSDLRALSYGPG